MCSRFIARRSSRSMRACTRRAKKYRVKSASIRPGFLRKTGAISCTDCVLPARMRNAVGHRAYRLGGRVGAGVDLREGRLVVPGHPFGGVRADRRGMALESDEVFKRGDLVQLGGVDEAHENIADARAVEGAVKEGIFPMQDRLFQGSFAHIIVQRGARYAQEQG